GTVEKFELFFWRKGRTFRLCTRLWWWSWYGVGRVPKGSTLGEQEKERKKEDRRQKLSIVAVHGGTNFLLMTNKYSDPTDQQRGEQLFSILWLSLLLFSVRRRVPE